MSRHPLQASSFLELLVSILKYTLSGKWQIYEWRVEEEEEGDLRSREEGRPRKGRE